MLKLIRDYFWQAVGIVVLAIVVASIAVPAVPLIAGGVIRATKEAVQYFRNSIDYQPKSTPPEKGPETP